MSDNTTPEPRRPEDDNPIDPAAEPQQSETPTDEAPEQPIAPPYASPEPPYTAPTDPTQAYTAPTDPTQAYGAPEQQPGGYSGYPAPPAPYGAQPPTDPAAGRGKGLALTALLLAVGALIFGATSFWWPSILLGTIVGIAAIVFGIIALVKKQSKGMSITALILAPVAAIVSGIVIAISFFAAVGSVIEEGPGGINEFLQENLTEEELEELGLGSGGTSDETGESGVPAPPVPSETPEDGTVVDAAPLTADAPTLVPTADIDGSWDFMVTVTNPNDDLYWDNGWIEYEAYDSDGAYLGGYSESRTIFPGENVIPGVLQGEGDLDVASVEIVLPDAAAASALPDGITSISDVLTVEPGEIVTEDGGTFVTATVTNVSDLTVSTAYLDAFVWDGSDLVAVNYTDAYGIAPGSSEEIELFLVPETVDIDDADVDLAVGLDTAY